MEDKSLTEMASKIMNTIDEVTLRAAEKIGKLLVRETVSVIDANKKNDTGDLRKSIHDSVEPEYLQDKIRQIVITIAAGVMYSKYIHDGTGPAAGHKRYYPPIYPIYYWVKRKGLAGRYSLKTHKRVGGKMQQYDETMAVAKRIAWKIYQKGTIGIKFFDIALKQAMPRIELEIAKIKI